MLTKKYNDLARCELKLDGLDEGQFSGYGSVNGNVDSYGDIIKRALLIRACLEIAISRCFIVTIRAKL